MKEYDISVISTPYFRQPSTAMGSVEKVSLQRFQALKGLKYKVNFIAPQLFSENQEDWFSIKVAAPSKIPDNHNKLRWMYSTRSFDYFTPYMSIPERKIGKLVFFDGWRLEPWDIIPLKMKLRKSYVINILHPPVIFIDHLPIQLFSPLYKRMIWGGLNTRINEYFLSKGYKSIYLPNGIIMPEKNKLLKDPEEFLIFFGRIEQSKGVHNAIKLARYLEIPLKIFGRIFDYNYFNSMVKPYIDSVKVLFYGEVPYSILFENLRRAKGYIYFSYGYDPLPTSILEAISYGVPVLGNALNPYSGFKDIVNDANGILIQLKHDLPDIRKDQIINILDGFDREKIYYSTETKWSWDNIIGRYYQKIINDILP